MSSKYNRKEFFQSIKPNDIEIATNTVIASIPSFEDRLNNNINDNKYILWNEEHNKIPFISSKIFIIILLIILGYFIIKIEK